MAPAGRRDSLGRGARDRILTATAELFARQGFNATGINELHTAARVSKRTLYQHFVSKDALILAYVDRYARTGPTETVLGREDLTPRTRLLEMFTALAEPETVIPDPIIAASLEFPDREHPLHQAVSERARRFDDRLIALAGAAGARNPERTARQLSTLYDGACCRLVVEDADTVVRDAYLIATVILREAID